MARNHQSPDLDNLIHVLLFLCILVLFSGIVLIFFQLKNLRAAPSGGSDVRRVVSKVEDCGDDCRGQITRLMADAIATLAGVPRTMITTSTVPQGQQTTYIPLNGSGSTDGNDWVDITSTDVWIDLKSEYSEGAYVDWEASIVNSSISGKTFVRLYDVTNKTMVPGSELSSSNTSSTRVSSGRLNLWAGHNLYRVQIRSLAPYKATFEGGRIKIVY